MTSRLAIPSGKVRRWWTTSPLRILRITWASEACDGKAYSPAFSAWPAPPACTAAMKKGAERMTPACSRSVAIS